MGTWTLWVAEVLLTCSSKKDKPLMGVVDSKLRSPVRPSVRRAITLKPSQTEKDPRSQQLKWPLFHKPQALDPNFTCSGGIKGVGRMRSSNPLETSKQLQHFLPPIYTLCDPRVQVSLWYILRPPKYPISRYHNDTWTPKIPYKYIP